MENELVNIEGAHFNKEELFEKVDSDAEIIELLFESVKGQVPGYLSTIENIVSTITSESQLTPEQAEDLRFAAHSIKGSAYNLCFERFGNIAKRVEMTARAWDAPGPEKGSEMLPHLYKLIMEEWEVVLSIMKN
ncbi:MAG: Hpt domain-containing protein [Bacteroidales bacterium]|nr:Hpt domain-containing protein [Bacteroidales bacterium]